jgi:hypothetical protein
MKHPHICSILRLFDKSLRYSEEQRCVERALEQLGVNIAKVCILDVTDDRYVYLQGSIPFEKFTEDFFFELYKQLTNRVDIEKAFHEMYAI